MQGSLVFLLTLSFRRSTVTLVWIVDQSFTFSELLKSRWVRVLGSLLRTALLMLEPPQLKNQAGSWCRFGVHQGCSWSMVLLVVFIDIISDLERRGSALFVLFVHSLFLGKDKKKKRFFFIHAVLWWCLCSSHYLNLFLILFLQAIHISSKYRKISSSIKND